MDSHNSTFLRVLVIIFVLNIKISSVQGIGVNWGTRATHPLSPNIVVKLMKDNGFNKVKLFEAEPWVLNALKNSGIQVMLGIPNDFLAPLASGVAVAEAWVTKNVSAYVSSGVDIRSVNIFVVHLRIRS